MMQQQEYDPELGKAERCIRWLLIGFNLITLIFACVLCALGAYALNSSLGAASGVTLPAAIIVMGVFLMLVSLLGAIAAWRENTLLLTIYFFVLLLLCLLLIIFGIAVYSQKNDSEGLMRQLWKVSSDDIKSYYQTIYECCGMDAYNDEWAPVLNVTDPKTNITRNVYECSARAKHLQQWCIPQMAKSFDREYVNAGIAGIVFALLMFAFMIFIYVLIKGIREKHREKLMRQDRAIEHTISKLQERSSQLAEANDDPTSIKHDDDIVIPDESYDVDIERGRISAVIEEDGDVEATPKPKKKKGKAAAAAAAAAAATTEPTATATAAANEGHALYDEDETTGEQVLVTSSTKKKKKKKQPRPEDIADEEGDEPSFV